ncbi:hypothetical protein SteCoe_4269 [Stentor coeruleus]|uniref:non-specific serine/threonine protein kinase n=1 Tax=Stentor coeruleus TaxID=5963 RepID=A0A1R2CVB8_9CILI|nr:hypothetical protein SteCoe_4269 [Stentor coeruleus]
MSSIFEKLDKETSQNDCFWLPLDVLVKRDIGHNKIYLAELYILTETKQVKSRNFILTKTRIYKCKKESEIPKAMTVITWKKLEPFEENQQLEKKYGFRLGYRPIFQDFYTNTEIELDEWISNLSRLTIMGELEYDYAIIKEIGKGNFATVYLAEETESHVQFAIKFIDKEYMSHCPGGVSAILNEVVIMKKINHPYILKLHRVYEDKHFIYLVLEYLKGGDLLRRLHKKEKFTESTAARFIVNLLESLKYLHASHIVHRDLKPENLLMITNDSDVDFKICDFGLAYMSSSNQNLRCGSPGYAAPEIIQKKPYNQKVDIFSAGILLYIVLSGRPPFRGQNVKEILKQNSICRLTFHDKCWDSISKKGKNMILSLTNPNPSLRLSAEQALRHPWLKVSNLLKLGKELLPQTACDQYDQCNISCVSFDEINLSSSHKYLKYIENTHLILKTIQDKNQPSPDEKCKKSTDIVSNPESQNNANNNDS